MHRMFIILGNTAFVWSVLHLKKYYSVCIIASVSEQGFAGCLPRLSQQITYKFCPDCHKSLHTSFAQTVTTIYIQVFIWFLIHTVPEPFPKNRKHVQSFVGDGHPNLSIKSLVFLNELILITQQMLLLRQLLHWTSSNSTYVCCVPHVLFSYLSSYPHWVQTSVAPGQRTCLTSQCTWFEGPMWSVLKQTIQMDSWWYECYYSESNGN